MTKDQNNSYVLKDNTELNRFEFDLGSDTAFSRYELKEDLIFLNHVEVPSEFGGQGIAGALMLESLKNIEKRELKVVPICSYAVSYFEKHPEWKKLLA